MSAETEAILQEVKSVKNVSVNGQLVKRGTRYMTHLEKSAKEDQLEAIEATLSPSNVASSTLSKEGRADLVRYKHYLRKDLEQNTPPPISAETRDALVKEEKRLAEKIREGMLPQEVMRRNPPGAVGHHTKWEKENKDDILAYKNIRRAVNPDDPDEDLANIEMLRPSLAGPGQASTFMSGAQIPGKFAMTPQAKENFDQAFPDSPTIHTPLKAAEDREREELLAKIAKLEAELKTDTERKARKAASRQAQSQKMKERWAAKKAQQSEA